MNSINNIDQLFKSKLENRAFVLEDAFIADLEAKLDQRKGGFFWWRLLFGFLLVGGLFFAGITYLNQDNNTFGNQEKLNVTVLPETLEEDEGDLIETNFSDNKSQKNINELKAEGEGRIQRINDNSERDKLGKENVDLKKVEIAPTTQKFGGGAKGFMRIDEIEKRKERIEKNTYHTTLFIGYRNRIVIA